MRQHLCLQVYAPAYVYTNVSGMYIDVDLYLALLFRASPSLVMKPGTGCGCWPRSMSRKMKQCRQAGGFAIPLPVLSLGHSMTPEQEPPRGYRLAYDGPRAQL